MRIALAGAGFACAVIARELAVHGHQVDVHERRAHVGGNCHTERDPATGVLLHRYGPHIFHTDDDEVWAFVNRFATFMPYLHRVKATVRGRVYSLPINLHTINQFFGQALSPAQARAWLRSRSEPAAAAPRNFEEQALQGLGRELYEAFLAGYTRKQWGRDPAELPVGILKRLPLRFCYDDNYFAHRHQGIPKEGYTALIGALLDHPNIDVNLGSTLTPDDFHRFDHVFHAGAIDETYGHPFGRLPYRTLDFERLDAECAGIDDFQGCAVMNHCDAEVPFTRITEHRHFAPWETHRQTVCFRETSREAGPGDTLYYPVHLAEGNELLRRYQALARQDTRVTFVGRLGTFRYMDMDVTIRHALDIARNFVACHPAPRARRARHTAKPAAQRADSRAAISNM